MKKTFTLSIAGRLFQVEEDAYALLLDYLDSLTIVFKGKDGEEIINDIEARISDLFQEKVDMGQIVFTVAGANEVIKVIGNAREIADESDEREDLECERGDSDTHAHDDNSCPPQPPCPPPSYMQIHRKLYRSQSDKVIGGVLGGMAIRFEINSTAIRLIAVLLAFCVGFFPLILAYCIMWACIPIANTPEKILEQQGRPVTVAAIGEVLNQQSMCPQPDNQDSFFRVIGALVMGFVGFIATIVGIGLAVGFICFLICSINAMCSDTLTLALINADYLHSYEGATFQSVMLFMSMAMVCLFLLLPCIATVWAACTVLFKTKAAGRRIWIIGLSIEIFALIFLCVAFILLN